MLDLDVMVTAVCEMPVEPRDALGQARDDATELRRYRVQRGGWVLAG